MTAKGERIRTEALALSDKDRAELAHQLILSLDAERDEDAEAAWEAELQRRLREVEEGKAHGRDADAVLDAIRAQYRE